MEFHRTQKYAYVSIIFITDVLVGTQKADKNQKIVRASVIEWAHSRWSPASNRRVIECRSGENFEIVERWGGDEGSCAFSSPPTPTPLSEGSRNKRESQYTVFNGNRKRISTTPENECLNEPAVSVPTFQSYLFCVCT
jgi:hypothetical protein